MSNPQEDYKISIGKHEIEKALKRNINRYIIILQIEKKIEKKEAIEQAVSYMGDVIKEAAES